MALVAALSAACSAAMGADAPKLVPKAEVSVKETFDSNVYLQDVGALRKQESFITTVVPKVSLAANLAPEFNVTLGYAPEVAEYHAEPSESFVAHRANLNLGGTVGRATWEQLNSFSWIDGSREGPTYAPPGDIPAVGGIPVRDRREAIVWRNSFKLSLPLGDHWFVRPVCSLYEHDFQTRQYTNTVGSPHYGYENYVDRQDLNGGLDIGYKIAENTSFIVGYRYGQQDQFKLLGNDSPYDSTYQRFLVGIEGAPADWLKLSILAGPDIRDFSPGTPAGFHPAEVLYWVDASVTIIPTKDDALVLSNRRYELPAFSSHSVYEDITYDVVWRHKCTSDMTANAGFRLYIGDWQGPVNREDWIYTPYASVTYAFNKHFTGEMSYSYDWVESRVPNRAGREYTRHLGAIGLKYTF